MNPVISLRGVRVHNLKSIDIDIPLGKWTVITGVSGAGKSSLVFDTIYAEAQRRYLQSFSVAIRQQLERFDQPDADSIGDLPPAIAVTGQMSFDPNATVGALTEIDDYLRLLMARAGTMHCPRCGTAVEPKRVAELLAHVETLPAGSRITIAYPARPEPEETPAAFAARLRAHGFVRLLVDGEIIRLDQAATSLPAAEEYCVVVDRLEAGRAEAARWRDAFEIAFKQGKERLFLITDSGEEVFDQRWRCPRCGLELPELEPRLLNRRDPRGMCSPCGGSGFVRESNPSRVIPPCTACKGYGLNEVAAGVRFAEQGISDLLAMQVSELSQMLSRIAPRVDTKDLLHELQRRLGTLIELDLGHLAPYRQGYLMGERKRLALAKVLFNNLVGGLYLLDEITAGLHPLELAKVLQMIRRLVEAGNTVVAVEHHPDAIRAADLVIDLGPGAGEEGGAVVAVGSPQNIADAADSVTGEFLSGRAVVTVPTRRRAPSNWLTMGRLKIKFPLGVLAVLTGPSNESKSVLVRVLARYLPKKGNKFEREETHEVLEGLSQVSDSVVVQWEGYGVPVKSSSRSAPVTILKIFDEIRDLFAETTEAKIRGFGPGHFSFNQPAGRCDACEGQGTLTVDMQFLADVTMTCPECHGSRYKKEILAVKVRNLSIADVLNLTVREAFRFFRAQRGLQRKLKWLIDVGLEYIRLGQPTESLSAGEAQRLALASHLAAARKPRTFFLLVEPSAGLHPADVQRLLDCLDGLVQTGHTVLVVDNNLDMIKCADYVIDLEPDGVAAAGTPEEVARVERSKIGPFLRRVLEEKS